MLVSEEIERVFLYFVSSEKLDRRRQNQDVFREFLYLAGLQSFLDL